MALIEQSLADNTGTLQLNRGEKHNSLNGELMRELMAGLDALVTDGARVVIVRAAPGVKVWSAGHDINELPEPRRDPQRRLRLPRAHRRREVPLRRVAVAVTVAEF